MVLSFLFTPDARVPVIYLFFSGVFYLFFSPFCAVLKQGSLLSSQRALEMLPPISSGVNPC